MNRFISAFHLVHYLLCAKTKHDVHSPFVFELLSNVIQNKKPNSVYNPIEEIRSAMLNDDTILQVNDLGAGSAVLKTKTRKISSIARYSLKSAKYSQLLFRLVNHFQPQTILELGTSLGITTLYLAKATPQAKVLSIEGSEGIAERAKQNFKKLQVTNIQLITGNFDNVLQTQLKELNQLDFVFVDGNHRKAPTLRYFEQCLAYAHNDSVFVFDDIHWSDEMREAWALIKNHERVTLTIDLFFIGLVFFRKEQVKQHFILRF